MWAIAFCSVGIAAAAHQRRGPLLVARELTDPSATKLPYVALSKTYSRDQQTSDSAPTMTAMVTGFKARESMLSVNHLTRRFETDPNVIAAN